MISLQFHETRIGVNEKRRFGAIAGNRPLGGRLQLLIRIVAVRPAGDCLTGLKLCTA